MKGEMHTVVGIFTDPIEKGHQEWRTFEVVQGDRVDIFDVPPPHWHADARQMGVFIQKIAQDTSAERYLH